MKIVQSLPCRVREIENLWIPLPDGRRLAARLWLPEDAERSPVPAVVEYIPYRKRDGTRWRDEPMHAYFAGHGYAAVRVDVRGSGDSEGVLRDEYLAEEQDDALQAIGWIARRPWCTGAVGMMGKSWGGFNALQVAALRPPALRAVLSVCSTDDRYADDAHYMGGCLLNENLVWGSVLFTLCAKPPDPEVVGDRWRAMWRERLESAEPFPALWLEHQLRDAYWRHGSVCEDYGAIECPVYAVGGWADAYTNAVPRLLEGLRCPRKGLVGPWAHLYPHEGRPGPPIGFLQEALRWWDRWLKDIENGIMKEPVYRVWMQESVPPAASARHRPGRWVAEEEWPSARIRPRCFVAVGRGLEPSEGPGNAASKGSGRRPSRRSPRGVRFSASAELCHRSPQTAGLDAGAWCSFGASGDLPGDQREDDGKSLVLESAPLGEQLEILGAPILWLALRVDRRSAFVVARLCDASPAGESLRVTYGLLNLTHRSGHDRAEPLEPGKRYDVRVRMNDVAHSFPPGHRIRLSLSTSYWPIAWPSPEPVTLKVIPSGMSLELPERPLRSGDADLRPFDEPESAPPLDSVDLHPAGNLRRLTRDLMTGETTYEVAKDAGGDEGVTVSRVRPIDLEVGHAIIERFRIADGDPLSARGEVEHRVTARRGDWSVRIETRSRLSATRDAFRLEAELGAWEGDERVFERTWDRNVRREGV